MMHSSIKKKYFKRFLGSDKSDDSAEQSRMSNKFFTKKLPQIFDFGETGAVTIC